MDNQRLAMCRQQGTESIGKNFGQEFRSRSLTKVWRKETSKDYPGAGQNTILGSCRFRIRNNSNWSWKTIQQWSHAGTRSTSVVCTVLISIRMQQKELGWFGPFPEAQYWLVECFPRAQPDILGLKGSGIDSFEFLWVISVKRHTCEPALKVSIVWARHKQKISVFCCIQIISVLCPCA